MAPKLNARFMGVVLRSSRRGQTFLRRDARFYIRDEVPGHFTRVVTERAFICLERKGMEPYPRATRQ